MTKEWIYRATKAELVTELQTLGIDTAGNIDDLRRRLSQFVSQHPEMFRSHTTEEKMVETPPIIVRPPEENITEDPAPKTIDQIRKWGCHFDGKDPVAFLERIEELRDAYSVPGAYLLRGLPELLRGDALLWYRNNRDQWQSWDDFVTDFREYYLPRRYRTQLVREIQGRLQAAEEPYRKFATELTTLMRRAGGYTASEQLDTLYENMHPRYRLYIPRDRISRANELLRRADEIEEIEARCKERTKAPAPTSTAATTYDRAECCWRCKQRGHTRFTCQRVPKKFCSQCGKDGVYTRDCHPPAGNAARTGDQADAPRSST